MRWWIGLLLIFSGTALAAPAGDLPPCSALGYVFSGGLPGTTEALRDALEAHATIAEAPVVFSQAPEASGLSEPRHLFGVGRSREKAGVIIPELNGRLFFGVSLKANRAKKRFDVKKVEFLSWNFASKRFDFGVIEGFGTAAARPVVDATGQCLRCHKHGGPLFRPFPWSNTTQAGAIRETFRRVAKEWHPAFQAEKPPDKVQGMRLLLSDLADFDTLVRAGTQALRLKQVVRELSPDERSRVARHVLTLHLLGRMGLFADRGNAAEEILFSERDGLAYTSLPRESPLRVSDTLVDIPVSTEGDDPALHSQVDEVIVPAIIRFDAKRMASLKSRTKPLSPPDLASRLTGGTLDDIYREALLPSPDFGLGTSFLSDGTGRALETAYRELPSTRDRSGWALKLELVEAVVGKEPLATWVKSGLLPDRPELLEALPKAISLALKDELGVDKAFPSEGRPVPGLAACASAPPAPGVRPASPGGKFCHRCHGADVPTAVYVLPFDPFDPVERQRWADTAPPERVVRTLGRLKERLFVDEDMPPPGEPERDTYLASPVSIEALRGFVDAELAKRSPRPAPR